MDDPKYTFAQENELSGQLPTVLSRSRSGAVHEKSVAR